MHAYKGPAALALQAAKSGRLWFSFPPSLVYKWEYQAGRSGRSKRSVPFSYLLALKDGLRVLQCCAAVFLAICWWLLIWERKL